MNYLQRKELKELLQEPKGYKPLRYIPKSLDILLLQDNMQLLSNYRETFFDSLASSEGLRAMLQRASIQCMGLFFAEVKNPHYWFKQLFCVPDSGHGDEKCPLYYSRNKRVLQFIEEKGKQLWGSFSWTDFLHDPDQIRHCLGKFVKQAQVDINLKLLEKQADLFFICRQKTIFEYIYTCDNAPVLDRYLQMVAQHGQQDQLMQTLFSRLEGYTHYKFINFFSLLCNRPQEHGNSRQVLLQWLQDNVEQQKINPHFVQWMTAYAVAYGCRDIFHALTSVTGYKACNIFKKLSSGHLLDYPADPELKYNIANVFDAATVMKWRAVMRQMKTREDFIDSLWSIALFRENIDEAFFVSHLMPSINWHETDSMGNTVLHCICTYINQLENKHYHDGMELLHAIFQHNSEIFSTKNDQDLCAMDIILQKPLGRNPETGEFIKKLQLAKQLYHLQESLPTQDLGKRKPKV